MQHFTKNNDFETRDYSEEAIPERDPSYRLQEGTLHEGKTVEALSAEERLELARKLQALGMSVIRASLVVRL